MPINPAKMDAFLNEAGPAPEDEMLEGEEGAEEPVAPEGDDTERFVKLTPLLEEFIEEIAEAADESDPDILLDIETPLESDDYEIIVESIAGLDRRLQKEMKVALTGGITGEEADALAEHLASEGMTEEPEKISGFLFRAAESYQGPPADEEEGEEEETEEEEGDEGEELPEPEDLLNEV